MGKHWGRCVNMINTYTKLSVNSMGRENEERSLGSTWWRQRTHLYCRETHTTQQPLLKFQTLKEPKTARNHMFSRLLNEARLTKKDWKNNSVLLYLLFSVTTHHQFI